MLVCCGSHEFRLSRFDEVGKEWRFPRDSTCSQSQGASHSSSAVVGPSRLPRTGTSSKGSEMHGHWERDESGSRKWVTRASTQMTDDGEYQVPTRVSFYLPKFLQVSNGALDVLSDWRIMIDILVAPT